MSFIHPISFNLITKKKIKAAETRAETSKTKQLLRSAEMRVLRNILRERIRSDDVRAECNVIDVARWVRTRETM
jgi:hypothetical protein